VVIKVTKNKIVSLFCGLFFLLSDTLFASSSSFIIKEGKVNVSGGQIWYKIVTTKNTSDKAPLIVLHGGPGVPHNYLNTLNALAADRPVIFYDQLGCGHSELSKNDNNLWTLDRFTGELETLVSHLHLKQFHLFGHSWGGALATQYALAHPKQLKSLTLASPLLSTEQWMLDAKGLIHQLDPDTQNIILTSEQQGTTDTPAYLNAVDSYYHHFVCRLQQWPKNLSYSFEHLNLDVYHTMWGPSEFTMNGNLKHFDVLNKLQNLSMPVLITGGQYDEARPTTLADAVKKIPHGQLTIYKNSAHVAFLEEKKQYLNDLRLFLRNTD